MSPLSLLVCLVPAREVGGPRRGPAASVGAAARSPAAPGAGRGHRHLEGEAGIGLTPQGALGWVVNRATTSLWGAGSQGHAHIVSPCTRGLRSTPQRPNSGRDSFRTACEPGWFRIPEGL